MKKRVEMGINKRFYELDLLRGAAILFMIVFHALHTLNFFGSYNFVLHRGSLFYFARAAASTFIILAGISLTISCSRKGAGAFKKSLKRGAAIFSWGLLITLITWFALDRGFVVFGILHFIGLSIMLAFPFLSLVRVNLLLGITIVLLGILIPQYTLETPWLVWLGFRPPGFYSIDYFPLFPWFGVFLMGIYLGNTFYPKARREFSLPEIPESLPLKYLSLIGRNSLLIYLLHQPVLIIVLFLSGFIGL